jgi:hypothetical protein
MTIVEEISNKLNQLKTMLDDNNASHTKLKNNINNYNINTKPNIQKQISKLNNYEFNNINDNLNNLLLNKLNNIDINIKHDKNINRLLEISNKTLKHFKTIQEGGGNYKNKYLKYKNKYLSLKYLINNQII